MSRPPVIADAIRRLCRRAGVHPGLVARIEIHPPDDYNDGEYCATLHTYVEDKDGTGQAKGASDPVPLIQDGEPVMTSVTIPVRTWRGV